MEIDLIRLINNIDDYVDIDLKYSFKDELKGTDIISLDDVNINGTITKDSLDGFLLDINVEGVMVLPCSLTLKPVPYPFNINIQGNIDEMLQEMDENAKKIINTIDILPIIWENILMEIPSKVVSPDASIKKEGEGWRMITGEEESENPELAKLKDLL